MLDAATIIGAIGTFSGLVMMFYSIRKHRTWLIGVSVLLIIAAVFMFGYQQGQEASVTSGSIPTPGTKEPSTADKATTVISQHGLDISVVRCRRITPGIECQLSVVSKDKTQELKVYASYGSNYRSRAYPGNGNDYTANYVKLGAGAEGNYHATNKLIQNEPMNVILQFSDVPAEATRLTSLNPSFQTKDRGNLENVVFRDIPIVDP